MKLSWNEIKDRALAFSKTWADESYEDGEAKSFLDEFFNVFGVSRKKVATFEKKVKKIDGNEGYIDLLWKGVILIEMKSRGKDLNKAFGQAKDYFYGLTSAEEPRYIMVCDFANIRLYDLENDGEFVQFKLAELYKKVKLFGFIAGYLTVEFKEQDPVNIKAAEKMGKLHDMLKACGYKDHKLELYLVRLLFCLFADDSSIFDKNIFFDYINESNVDGSDLAPRLSKLFEVLNTPISERMSTLNESLTEFPYVNGGLFKEQIPMPDFDGKMRDMLLDIAKLNWNAISPAIFGSMFQSIMDEKARRALGAHYTSEKNIMKVIKPLFLDSLYAEFNSAKGNKKRLEALRDKLGKLKFFDPACGCGNFLVIAYRELRLLEIEILRELFNSQLILDIGMLINVNVSQFYGIELEEFPALIAQTAMWLIDHQMNMIASEEFGQYFVRLPLKQTATIVCGNALTLDWNTIVPKNELSYIMGNPPFVGAMNMDKTQRKEIVDVFGTDFNGSGEVDYVSGWYIKAAQYIQGTFITCAFVSTNSICQGQQVALLWHELMTKYGICIHFAHKTFKWSNEAKHNASVFCIIVGFATYPAKNCTIYEYDNIKDNEGMAVSAKHINGYLVDAPDVFIFNRSKPLCKVEPIRFGSMPRDGGNFVLSDEEREQIISQYPQADKWIKKYVGAYEFINRKSRWCLWLKGVSPKDIKECPPIMERVEKVRKFRADSIAAGTRKFAATPTLFCQIAQPDTDYIIVPKASSERRTIMPIGLMNKDTIASDLVFLIPDGSLYTFGVITSTMHMAWMRHTCGRLKSDYRYAKDIVYNNFPFPTPTDKQRAEIEKCAQNVLAARDNYPECSLADLYDPNTMPPELVKAHDKLDRAVEKAYGRSFNTDSERVAFLFEKFLELTEK